MEVMQLSDTWDSLIELGNAAEAVVHNEVISSMEYREVFANELSVRQSEFYQAAVAGLKPELIFEVHDFEYDNDKKVRYPAGVDGVEYSIIRAYKNKKGNVELVISTHVGTVI